MIVMLLGSFAMEGSAAGEDNDAPLLTSVRMLDEKAKAGDDIRIELGIRESVSGLKRIVVQLNHSVYGQMILTEKVWSVPQFSKDNDSFVYTLNMPTSPTKLDGKWFIGLIELYDARGNFNRFYGGADTDLVVSEGFDHKDAKVVSPLPHIQLYGSTGSPQPVKLDKVVIKNKTVGKNESLKIEATVTCEKYISYIHFHFVNDAANKEFTRTYEAQLARLGTKTYKAEFPIGEKIRSGEWRIQHIHITDLGGMNTWYTSEGYDGAFVNGDTGEIVSKTPVFRVEGEDKDVTDPEVLSIRVLNDEQKIRKPETLMIEVEVLEEDSGITNLEFATECVSGLDSDRKSKVFRRFSAKGYSYRDDPDKVYSSEITEEFYDQPLKTGTYEFQIPIPENVKNGDYVVYIRELWDAENNRTLCYTLNTITGSFKVSTELPSAFEMQNTDENLPLSIEQMGENEAGVILFREGEKPILPEAAVEAIAGKNKTIICDMGQYQWVINGLDIWAENAAEIDLTTEFREMELKTIKNPQKVLKMSFAEENDLLEKFQLRIKTDFVKDHLDQEDKLWVYAVGSTAEEGIEYQYIPRKESNIQVLFEDDEYWCALNISQYGEYILGEEEIKPLTIDDIAAIGSMEYAYTGEEICPQPRMELDGRLIVPGLDYVSTYRNNTQVGIASMVLTCIGDYEELGSKEFFFTITPGTPVIRKARGGIRRMRVKWERTKEKVDGYEMQYGTSAEMESAQTVKLKRRTAKTLKKLNSNETYYVRVRAWKEVENRKYFSPWSSVEAVTIR